MAVICVVLILGIFASGSSATTCPSGWICAQPIESCHQLRQANYPSGQYYLKTKEHEDIISVFCEFRDDGKTFTFIHPDSLASLSNIDLSALMTSLEEVQVRYFLHSGEQKYVILEQLDQNKNNPLGITVNFQYQTSHWSYSDYFLFVSFTPPNRISKGTLDGVAINGDQWSFTNCDGNPSSNLVMMSHSSAQSLGYTTMNSGWRNGFGLCQDLYNKALPVSKNMLPADFSSFGIVFFGGCGADCRTDAGETVIQGLSIGLA